MRDPIQDIAWQLGITTFGDGLLTKIRETIDLLQSDANNLTQYKEVAAELEAELAEVKGSTAYRTSLIGRTEKERNDLKSELAASNSRLHEVATLCATVEHELATLKAKAAVPDVNQLIAVLERVRLSDEESKRHGNGSTYWNNAVLACQIAIRDELAAATAQPPSQGGEAVEVVASIAVDAEGVVRDFTLEPGLDRHPGGYTVTSLMTVTQHKRILADLEANRDALLLVMQVESALKAAQPQSAVIVPRELANKLVSTDNHVRQTARRELRNSLLGGDHDPAL